MKKLLLEITFEALELCNPDQVEKSAFLTVGGKHFLKEKFKRNVFNASSYTAYPGLINAHDHLLGSYLPKVGNGPYLCWKPWDDDLKASKLYNERGKLTTEEIYTLSYYRQILSGVTTVCDHIPHQINERFIPSSFVRIIAQYCLAHEMSSYELKWGEAHEVEIARAKAEGLPFITHLEEGFDNESKRGVDILNGLGGLCRNAVLVHCINCSKADINLIAKSGASMVWCPNSNFFMFQKTAPIKSFLKAGVNVCLGTDSPMSGSTSLLEELSFAKKTYAQLYGEPLSTELLLRMVTNNPVKAFRLTEGLGSLEADKLADFILIKNYHDDPYEQLVESKLEDLFLVVREGVPLYLREEVVEKVLSKKIQFELLEKNYEKVELETEGASFCGYLIGAPGTFKRKLDEKLGFEKEFSFFPIKNKSTLP